MVIKKRVRLLRPVNLDLEALIKNASEADLFKGTSCERLVCDQLRAEKSRWLKPIRVRKLDWILTKIGNRQANDMCDFGGYVSLDSRMLQKNLGADFARDGRIMLENLGVIESCPYSYRVGVRPRSFRLSPRYENQRRTIISNHCFNETDAPPECDEQPRIEICEVQTDFHKHLIDSLRSVTISSEATKHIQDLRFTDGRGERCLDRIQRIQNGVWFFKMDKFGRIYSNVTGLPDKTTDADGKRVELRRFLQLDGNQLQETDVHASHPFLCADLYSLADATAADVAAERERYFALFENDFYGEVSRVLATADRNTVKKYWLAEIINRSKPKSPEGLTLQKAFIAKFPILAACMNRKRESCYKHIAHHLMRLESKLIIETACRAVYEATKAPLLTVHDSILHRPEDAAMVRTQIETAFRNHFGMTCRLKSKLP